MPIRSYERYLYETRSQFQSTVVKRNRRKPPNIATCFEWQEPLQKAPSHRILAVLRGQRRSFLTVHARPSEEEAIVALEKLVLRGEGPAIEHVREAAHDAYKRLLAPSLEGETLKAAKERADRKQFRCLSPICADCSYRRP